MQRKNSSHLFSFVDIVDELSFWRILTVRTIDRWGRPRFSTDENNQKATSRIASASANTLYHRILDTSTPHTCSEFANLRDATPYERHICRVSSAQDPFYHPMMYHCILVVPWYFTSRRVHGYYYRRASAVRYGNTPILDFAESSTRVECTKFTLLPIFAWQRLTAHIRTGVED